MLTIIRGVTSKQAFTDQVEDILDKMNLDGYFYLGHPVLGGMDGKIKADALLFCRQYGLVVFDLDMAERCDVVSNREQSCSMEVLLSRYSAMTRSMKYSP